MENERTDRNRIGLKKHHKRVTRTTSFLISATKRDQEAMIRDITTELEAVGLGLGANKTHWSSYHAKPGQTLHVDTEHTQWKQVLAFVRMALVSSGSS